MKFMTYMRFALFSHLIDPLVRAHCTKRLGLRKIDTTDRMIHDTAAYTDRPIAFASIKNEMSSSHHMTLLYHAVVGSK